MNDKAGRGNVGVSRPRRRAFRTLAILGLLLLPIAAYALSVYALSTTGTVDPDQHFLRDQVLLVLTGIAVSGIGAFLIWSTSTALARVSRDEVLPARPRDEPGRTLPDRQAFSSSLTRMLGTIERQSEEIKGFAGQLDNAHRELESTRARLDENTFIDDATGLHNERFLVARLEQEVARYHRFGHPVSLVLIGLDGIGAASRPSSAIGADEVARGVIEVLLKHSRSVDVVCRNGQDELAVLLVQTPRSEAGAYGPRIRDVLSTCLWANGEQVSACFGTASLPDDAFSGHGLVRAAGEALDAAKRLGRNGIAVYGEPGSESMTTGEVGAA
jgi:diguanylate cyclase (GGDEF)-like protein